MIYLFDSDKLYYKNPPNPAFAYRKVKPMEIRCHNVTTLRVGGAAIGEDVYDFQLVGGDGTWFRTRYHWALVVDSPENRALIAEAERLSKERDAIMESYSAAERKVQTARTVHLGAIHGRNNT